MANILLKGLTQRGKSRVGTYGPEFFFEACAGDKILVRSLEEKWGKGEPKHPWFGWFNVCPHQQPEVQIVK